MPETETKLPWFALVVRPHHEQTVRDGLTMKGLENFLPQYTAMRHWSDRSKRLSLPLFPGYVFCRFEPGRPTPVLRTPGVRSAVSFGKILTSIPESDIQRLRLIVDSGSGVEPWPYIQVGQRMRINAGPLAGLDGILQEVRNTWRIVVGVDLLQRSIAVQLERDQVTPLN